MSGGRGWTLDPRVDPHSPGSGPFRASLASPTIRPRRRTRIAGSGDATLAGDPSRGPLADRPLAIRAVDFGLSRLSTTAGRALLPGSGRSRPPRGRPGSTPGPRTARASGSRRRRPRALGTDCRAGGLAVAMGPLRDPAEFADEFGISLRFRRAYRALARPGLEADVASHRSDSPFRVRLRRDLDGKRDGRSVGDKSHVAISNPLDRYPCL